MDHDQYRRLDDCCQRALDYMDSLTLADIRVARVALRYSYRLGLLAAQFTSRAMLFFETGLSQGQLSKSLAKLAKANVLTVTESKRGGTVTLTVNTAYWQWDGGHIQATMVDKTILQTMVNGGHPKQVLAARRSLEQLETHPEFWPAEDTFTDALAAVAREEALAAGPLFPTAPDAAVALPARARTFQTESSAPPLSSITPSPINSISLSSIRDGGVEEGGAFQAETGRVVNNSGEVDLNELSDMAGRLWPWWEARRRDGWLRAVAAKRGRSTVFIALQRAADKQHTSDPVKYPFGWLPGAFDRIEAERKTRANVEVSDGER